MRTITAVVASSALVLASAGWFAPASAQMPSSRMHDQMQQQGTMEQQGTVPQGTQQPGIQSTQSGQAMPAENMFSEQIRGQVTNVDHQTGRVTMNTIDGPVTLRFTPDAVQNVSNGQEIVVGFGLIEPQPSASPNTSPSSQGTYGNQGTSGNQYGTQGNQGTQGSSGSTR